MLFNRECSSILFPQFIFLILLFSLIHSPVYGQIAIDDGLDGKILTHTDVSSFTELMIAVTDPALTVKKIDISVDGRFLKEFESLNPGIIAEVEGAKTKTIYWDTKRDLTILPEGRHAIQYRVYWSDGSTSNKTSSLTMDYTPPKIRVVNLRGPLKQFWIEDLHEIKTVHVEVLKNQQLVAVKELNKAVDLKTTQVYYFFSEPQEPFIVSAIDQAGNYIQQASPGTTLEEIFSKIDVSSRKPPDNPNHPNSGACDYSIKIDMFFPYENTVETEAAVKAKVTLYKPHLMKGLELLQTILKSHGYPVTLIDAQNIDKVVRAEPLHLKVSEINFFDYKRDPTTMKTFLHFYGDDLNVLAEFMIWALKQKTGREDRLMLFFVDDLELPQTPQQPYTCGITYRNGIILIETINDLQSNCHKALVDIVKTIAHEIAHAWGIDHDNQAGNTSNIMKPVPTKEANEFRTDVRNGVKVSYQATTFLGHLCSANTSVRYPKPGVPNWLPRLAGQHPKENVCGNGFTGAFEECEDTTQKGGAAKNCLEFDPKKSFPPDVQQDFMCKHLITAPTAPESDCVCEKFTGGGGGIPTPAPPRPVDRPNPPIKKTDPVTPYNCEDPRRQPPPECNRTKPCLPPKTCNTFSCTCDDACGNGQLDAGEQCDPGGGPNAGGRKVACQNPKAICKKDCTCTLCGNNTLDPGEQCDPPGSRQICICQKYNGIHYVQCTDDCKIPSCEHEGPNDH